MLSIIIPTLNEEEGIAKVICSIPEEIRKQSEVIVIDVSTDYTPIIAERLGARVIRETIKGKGRQMRRAVAESRGDTLIFLDGDGTDPAEFIPLLLKELESADLVLGCRSLKEFDSDDKEMRNIYKIYRFYIRPFFSLINFNVSDPLAGFRAIKKKDWEILNLQSDSFEIETEMDIKAMQKGFIVKEVAIPNLKRCGGLRKSKFINDPKQWFEISKIFLKYFRDEKLKKRIKEWQLKLKSKLEI